MESLNRGVDRLGPTVDFLLTTQRGVAAARRFFERVIDRHDVPERVTIDTSGADTASVQASPPALEGHPFARSAASGRVP